MLLTPQHKNKDKIPFKVLTNRTITQNDSRALQRHKPTDRRLIMEIAGVSTAAAQSLSSASNTPDPVGNQMLRKTLDMQEQTAAQLIESVPDPDSNVGQNVDIKV